MFIWTENIGQGEEISTNAVLEIRQNCDFVDDNLGCSVHNSTVQSTNDSFCSTHYINYLGSHDAGHLTNHYYSNKTSWNTFVNSFDNGDIASYDFNWWVNLPYVYSAE